MHHKLQPSPLKNNGLNSVVRENPQPSSSPIASNDAAPEHTSPPAERNSDHDSQNVPTENPQGFPTAESEPRTIATESSPQVGDSRDSKLTRGPSTCAQEGRPVPRLARCEVARSSGHDPTGEHAVACGAVADVVCEYCGPMCASCAEETFCFYGEHRFVDLSAAETANANSEAVSEAPKSLFEVVYLELKCPYCDTLRLALPADHLPSAGATLGCPICATPTAWTYLAHGVTQRDLPFYERFDPDALTRGRIPWDQLTAPLDDDE